MWFFSWGFLLLKFPGLISDDVARARLRIQSNETGLCSSDMLHSFRLSVSALTCVWIRHLGKLKQPTAGSMLPFICRRCGLDPASASARSLRTWWMSLDWSFTSRLPALFCGESCFRRIRLTSVRLLAYSITVHIVFRVGSEPVDQTRSSKQSFRDVPKHGVHPYLQEVPRFAW